MLPGHLTEQIKATDSLLRIFVLMVQILVGALSPRYWPNCGGKAGSLEESHAGDVGISVETHYLSENCFFIGHGEVGISLHGQPS
jgi:hypothetical protein